MKAWVAKGFTLLSNDFGLSFPSLFACTNSRFCLVTWLHQFLIFLAQNPVVQYSNFSDQNSPQNQPQISACFPLFVASLQPAFLANLSSKLLELLVVAPSDRSTLKNPNSHFGSQFFSPCSTAGLGLEMGIQKFFTLWLTWFHKTDYP